MATENSLSRSDREKIARRRLVSVLESHDIALGRTLEQKICDAGPNPLRVNPHILTSARKTLLEQGRIKRLQRRESPWFHLNDAEPPVIEARLAEQEPVHQAMLQRAMILSIGQALEIAVYRGLLLQPLDFLGGFSDLEKHDDSTFYKKIEPPSQLSGRRLMDASKLDFLVRHGNAGWAGIEAKNVREWLYPDRPEIREVLRKAVALDVVPVLIARRVPYVTFYLLKRCGVLIHETYNQRFPNSGRALAEKAAHKNLLGFHDIRVGNEPDPRLIRFLSQNLPALLPEARQNFDTYKDLLEGYATESMDYAEFAARLRRRAEGTNEDFDEMEP